MKPYDIDIDYRLVGSGWAECVVSSDGQTCLLTASYLSNALGNLVLAANCVLGGFSTLTFRFDDEPGEFRWLITSPRPRESNEIQIDIREFSDLWGGRPDEEGLLRYTSRCRPIVFARAVEEAARRVLEACGEAGYQDQWDEHPFPTAQYLDLVKAIDEHGED